MTYSDTFDGFMDDPLGWASRLVLAHAQPSEEPDPEEETECVIVRLSDRRETT